MKIYISHDTGNLLWLKDDVLMACPLPKDDGLIDLEKESCEIEMFRISEDEQEFCHKVKTELEY